MFRFPKGFPALRDGFTECGRKVVEIDWQPSDDILQSATAVVMDIYDAARHPWQAWCLHKRAKKHRIPIIAVDRDSPWHKGLRKRRLRLLSWLKCIDAYASHSMQTVWQFAPIKHYLANAAWPTHYNLNSHTLDEMRHPDFFRYDVSFIGNINGHRYREHLKRQQFLEALKPRLEAKGLRVFIARSEGISTAEQIEITQRSMINLNVGAACDHGGEKSWGLAERCYGVPAVGGFLLSDERKHAGDDFDLEHEWASFSDFDDCLEKIDYYLARFDNMRTIAEAAHKKVMSTHTYRHRAQSLLTLISQIKK